MSPDHIYSNPNLWNTPSKANWTSALNRVPTLLSAAICMTVNVPSRVEGCAATKNISHAWPSASPESKIEQPAADCLHSTWATHEPWTLHTLVPLPYPRKGKARLAAMYDAARAAGPHKLPHSSTHSPTPWNVFPIPALPCSMAPILAPSCSTRQSIAESYALSICLPHRTRRPGYGALIFFHIADHTVPRQ